MTERYNTVYSKITELIKGIVNPQIQSSLISRCLHQEILSPSMRAYAHTHTHTHTYLHTRTQAGTHLDVYTEAKHKHIVYVYT